MSNGTGYNNSAVTCNNTNPADSYNNNLMDRRHTSRMAVSNGTISNSNINDIKSMATCDSSNLAAAYNNNPASIICNSNNSKSMAAYDISESSTTRNNNPSDIISSSSRMYSSSNKGGSSMILNMEGRRMIVSVKIMTNT